MSKLKKGISFVVNTKNESDNIAKCLSSAASIVNEIIVVDMQSVDDTTLIAKKLGARVFKVKDYGYVEPARVYAINKASYEWVLVLDADERLRKSLASKIVEIVNEDKYDVVYIPHKNIVLGKWIKHSGSWPDYHGRLFKKGAVNWPKGIHKQPDYKGKPLKLKPIEVNAILHYGNRDTDQIIDKTVSYSKHEKNLINKRLTNPSEMLAYMDDEFLSRYFDQKGYLDGMHGYVLSKFMETYRFFELVRFWEREGYKAAFDSKELHKAVKNNYGRRKDEAELKRLREKVANLEGVLANIQSAKFFRVWQYYCNKRDSVLKRNVYDDQEQFYIKSGYRHNFKTSSFLDDEMASKAWQYQVYKLVRNLVVDKKLNSVLDIGCGYGKKLEELIQPVCNNIVGIDFKHSIDYCKRNYDFGRWYVDDVENSKLRMKEKFDLIIAADVIEHLKNPDKLFDYFSNYAYANTYIIISTPERDIVRGKSDMGPPNNPAHVREWNKKEFARYIESKGLKIIRYLLATDFKDGRLKDGPDNSKSNQVIIAKLEKN